MRVLHLWLSTWLETEDAQDLIEYAVIIGLVITVAVIGLTVLGGQISTLWSSVGTWMTNIVTQIGL